MPIRLRTLPIIGILAGITVSARAQAVPGDTLPGLVQKSQALVVGEVLKIETLSEARAEKWNRVVVEKQATVRILRGMNSADASPFDGEQIAIHFSAFKPDQLPAAGLPVFPDLTEKQIALFPVSRIPNSSAWQLASDNGNTAVMPAALHPMGSYLNTQNLPLGFVYQELAGALVYGEYSAMGRAGLFLENLGPDPESPVEPLFALIRREIGDSSLSEDPRWIHITMAAYCAVPLPRPSLSDLLLLDKLPDRKGLALAALALRKAGKSNLDQRLALLLYNHQEDPGMAGSTAGAIAQNFAGDPYLISMERDAIKALKPGAFYIGLYLIKDNKHPLAATALQAARDLIGPDSPFRQYPPVVDSTQLLGQAIDLLTKLGSDADVQYLMDQITAGAKIPGGDRRGYQLILTSAGRVGAAAGIGPAATPVSRSRMAKLFAAYIEDTIPMTQGTSVPDFRVCDYAAQRVQETSQHDFGFKSSDPPETRDAAIEKVKNWLKSQ